MKKDKNTKSGLDRRGFIKAAGMGGLGLGALATGPTEAQVEHLTSNVNRNSSPSELKITDMRVAEVTGIPFRVPIIRIDTNQGISGYGEVRDGGTKEYALMLKSRILGRNPCNVEWIIRDLEQFRGEGRQGGGVSAVEMALWDIAGKAYGVPVYQLLGGKYRSKIQLYADTSGAADPHEFARNMLETRVKEGYTALKMDIGIELLSRTPGTLVNSRAHAPVGEHELQSQYSRTRGEYGTIEHPFTRIQITQKGLELMEEYVRVMRETVGYEIPLGIDHFGHFDVDEAIKICQMLEPYTIAYAEDLVAWTWTDKWREITAATTTPTQTGEDIGTWSGCKPLIDKRAVNIIHPDPGSSGVLGTKKIGDYAQEAGIAMNLHFAGSPVGFLASVHIAAATQNFNTLEHHSVGLQRWYDIYDGDPSMIFDQGYATVPEKPGLGVELNMDAVRESLIEGGGFFEPTPEWDDIRAHDRIWS
jgi:L-alanine-DL-glutamate epimerase-like enolase superfamily enzyme